MPSEIAGSPQSGASNLAEPEMIAPASALPDNNAGIPAGGTSRRPGLEAVAVAGLLIILALGAYFRFVGINWDSGSHLHPDERFLTIVASQLSGVDNPLDYLRTSRSTLNP
jgi:hypothetical protein